MSSSLIRRLGPYLAARFRQNQRVIITTSTTSSSSSSSTYASSAASVIHHAVSSSSFSSSASMEFVHMTESCVRRMKELEGSESSKLLRLSVETGGCSGFQYVFNLDHTINSDDRVFERDGIKLVIDNVSYDFVRGATVDYVEELIRSAFVVTENPSAVGGCSCKSSFMVKQ